MIPGEKGYGKSAAEKPTEAKEKPTGSDFAKREAELKELQQKLAEAKKELAGLTERRVEGEKKPEAAPEAEPKVEEGAATKERSEAASKPAPAPSLQPPKGAKGIKELDAQNQVKVLCNLAFEKGISDAIKTARELDNAYILDEFHDALIDELYQRLIEEKKIAEV